MDLVFSGFFVFVVVVAVIEMYCLSDESIWATDSFVSLDNWVFLRWICQSFCVMFILKLGGQMFKYMCVFIYVYIIQFGTMCSLAEKL